MVVQGSFEYCIFNNNKALNEGNEIYIDSTKLTNPACTLNNCNFTNCVSDENWMISYNGLSKLIINNFRFINCSSSSNGGAVNLKYGKVYFTNCCFEGNSAVKGGAINYNEYIISLENCYFKNNSATYGGAIYTELMNNIDMCSFENNNAIEAGNEIFFNGTGNLKLTNCNFSRCISNEGSWFIAYNNINSLTIDACNFINCSSRGNGGAIFLKDDLTYTIVNSYFEGNKATNGGVIYSKMKTFSCNNCTFANNQADYGGAIYVERVSTIGITDCTFINNYATDGGAFYSNQANFKCDNCNFTENRAKSGGAIYVINVQESNITNCVFEQNNGGYGAGIYSEKSSSLIDNCKFIMQKAYWLYNTGQSWYLDGMGGALNVVDSEIEVYNSNFTDNYAFAMGGGVYGDVNAVNCLFYNNVGDMGEGGGAMYGGTARNCTFEYNDASNGGAMYEGTVINCTFISNVVHRSDGKGGAVYDTNALNCTFIKNTALNNGGAMYGGNAYNCIFINNTAYKNGGAIFEGNVTNSTFINNRAQVDGGAVYGSNKNIFDCTFINCSAGNNGGAIAFDTSDSISLANSQFINCHSNNQSGAVHLSQCENLTILNCSFENCSSKENGSYLGINESANVNIKDCVFDEIPEGITVNYSSHLYVNNLKTILGENSILIVNLSNVQGPLFNKTVTLTFGEHNCNATTDENGLAIFDLKEYLTKPGKYTVEVSFSGDGVNSNATASSNVTVNSYQGILICNAEGKYYDDVSLNFKLINSKTNEDIDNATVEIKFSNGETVYLKTNNKGIATYHVPFAPGTYNAAASVVDVNVDVNNVTITDMLINKIDGLMKVTQVDNVLNVRVYNPIDGHLYRNITVTLKFNHMDPVNVVTNENGVAVYNMDFDYGTYSVFASVSKPYTNIDAVSVDDIVIKEDNSYATVSFSSGIVFEYGTSGSIYVTVKGGSVEIENIKVLNHPEARITLVKNVITVSNLNPGIYTLMVVSTPFGDFKAGNGTVNINVKKATAVIKAQKLTVALKKGTKWTITLVNAKTGKPISNMKLTLKVYTGKKYKTVHVTTNSNGVASYQTRGLSKGTHKVVVGAVDSRYNFNTLTSSIKVVKQKVLKFKVKKNIKNDGSSLSITAKYKNKGINGVKLNVLVYNGKKLVKKVSLKTKTKGKYKGVCGWGTNKLTVGSHKIVIVPANIKYGGSKKLNMKIKKSAKKYPNWETKI